jgi:hypothetical protein
LPPDGISCCYRSSDSIERLLETRSGSENGATVFESVANLVTEISEGVSLLCAEWARVVRVVEVANDDSDEFDKDLKERFDRRFSS